MRSLISYFGHTIRRLAKSPGFTVTAVLILGLGIGANTAIFSLISGVLLKPLPYPHPERLVNVFEPFANFDRANINYRDYLDYSAINIRLMRLLSFGRRISIYPGEANRNASAVSMFPARFSTF